MLQIRRKDTGEILEVRKYSRSGGEEPQENIWCDAWYGRHVIGVDCDWVESDVFNMQELRTLDYCCRAAMIQSDANTSHLVEILNLKKKVVSLIKKPYKLL